MKRVFCRVIFLLALMLLPLLSACASHGQEPTDLQPILCHPEPGIGMVFITIQNNGHDAGPSTTEVTYSTHSAQTPHVQLAVPTPTIPAKTEIWLMVNLPFERETNSFLQPKGKITIVVDARHQLPETNRANTTLRTYCNDAA